MWRCGACRTHGVSHTPCRRRTCRALADSGTRAGPSLLRWRRRTRRSRQGSTSARQPRRAQRYTQRLCAAALATAASTSQE
eukprot:2623317-Pleurochrysis_carterae.AAC.2